jgi:hypothetical protein
MAVLLCNVSGAAPPVVPGSSDVPDVQSLNDALARLKLLVDANNYRRFGFDSETQAASASLGIPLRRYLIRSDKWRSFGGGADPAALLEDTRQWIYPVVAGGKVRCSFTIAWRKPGVWKAISFGDPVLAETAFRTRAEEAQKPLPRLAQEVFFLVDLLGADRKFIVRRLDGGAPDQQPGRQTLRFTWLGTPAAGQEPTGSAEAVLGVLSKTLPQPRGQGPGR